MLKLNNRIIRNDRFPYRIIGEEVILVDVERGSIIQLNEIAAFIWNKLDTERKVVELIDCIYDSFEVEKERVKKDTLEFLNALLKKRLILQK